MIRSMTGFGEAERETAAGRLRAEVRTVNHRHFSANLRLARPAERYEPQVRDTLRVHLPRGHVNFSLRIEPLNGGAAASNGLRLDEARARAYVAALRALKSSLDLAGDVDLALLSRFGDLIVPDTESDTTPVVLEDVVAVTAAAAQAAVGMREEEGRRLVTDLRNRLAAMEDALVRIEQRAPARLVSERDRMRRVVGELLGDITMDDDRIAREVAFMAEKLDISEELVRMRSHIELFLVSLDDSATEQSGKRLSFLAQEMNREANTIGSKASDAAIEHDVIVLKEEIERIREQVENIE